MKEEITEINLNAGRILNEEFYDNPLQMRILGSHGDMTNSPIEIETNGFHAETSRLKLRKKEMDESADEEEEIEIPITRIDTTTTPEQTLFVIGELPKISHWENRYENMDIYRRRKSMIGAVGLMLAYMALFYYAFFAPPTTDLSGLTDSYFLTFTVSGIALLAASIMLTSGDKSLMTIELTKEWSVEGEPRGFGLYSPASLSLTQKAQLFGINTPAKVMKFFDRVFFEISKQDAARRLMEKSAGELAQASLSTASNLFSASIGTYMNETQKEILAKREENKRAATLTGIIMGSLILMMLIYALMLG